MWRKKLLSRAMPLVVALVSFAHVRATGALVGASAPADAIAPFADAARHDVEDMRVVFVGDEVWVSRDRASPDAPPRIALRLVAR
jgi:hypothetical protein